ncbi:MAG: sigma-70 family RNA polymerase sigma factor [Alphaproteobacteria bacterium]|nr:sigma-70 family RNA polymerase sigma factor [Alphaproteobacteria bacterium]
MFRFILKQVGDRADAEDLTQEAFLQAFRGFESFQGRSLPSTWLFGIAVNVVRTHLRRSPQLRHTYVPEEALAELPNEGNPLADLEMRRRIEALDAALFRLPDDWREVLVCVSMEGLSYEQTATVLDLPIGTVRSRLSRARERLAADLMQEETA